MRKAHLLLFLSALLALSSCVTNKKILYLQKERDLKKKKNPPDSATRNYELVDFAYKIQTYDLVSVRYQSLTEKEFDFLNNPTQTSSSPTSTPTSAPSSSSTSSSGISLFAALMLGEMVDEKGEIPMLFVGKVHVAGLTIFQIQDTLQKIANVYLESPIVKCRLLNYRATVLGEVFLEGVVNFTHTNRISLLEAIGQAGGLIDLADRSNIKVIRQSGDKVEVHYVNLLDEDFITSPYYYVYQNDIIIVPPLKQRAFRKYFAQNMALILSSISLFLVTVSLLQK